MGPLLAGMLIAVFAARGAAAQGCEFWVAPPPAGNDLAAGTFAAPWATFQHAINTIPDSGCTVWAKDGVYNGRQRMNRRFTQPATFRAVNPYRAVFQAAETVITIYGGRNIVLEGLEVRHTGPGAGALVIQVQQQDFDTWAEDIVIRNNVLHDSFNNDILKINNGARRITVEGNVFYNQSGSDEHMDVNSVTDVDIRDNIFFNDFAGSGRVNGSDTSSHIVIKDSNQDQDGQVGSARIQVRRNVFLNWEGSAGNPFVLTGEDGQAYHEAVDVTVENNLMIGNSGNEMRAAFGVKGCRNITFRNNTVVGDLPSCAYALRLNQESLNPVNENIVFYNNIWSDPTGTMGQGCASATNDFSDGGPAETTGEVLDRNLYWNGGAAIPPGDVLSPLVHDVNRIVANPLLATNQAAVVLPRWTGTSFVSGNATIRQEFVRLVNAYAALPANSPAVGQANASRAPADDILGRSRTTPDLGAFESFSSTLSVGDVSVSEGASGTAAAAFTVSLTPASAQAVSVSYATADNTAGAPSDYAAASGSTTFAPGETSRTVTVLVNGDIADEADETFFLNLSSPSSGAVLGDAQGVATIVDDDPNADLAVSKGNGASSVTVGQVVTYTIVASNAGPNDAPGTTITDTLPATLTSASWTCGAAGGAFCGTASGNGSIAQTVSLPVGGSVTYTLTATVAGGAGTVTNTATATVPPGFGDPNPANNSASDADVVICSAETVVVPDGRSTSHALAPGATAWFLVSLRLQGSYSVELRRADGLLPPGTLTGFRGEDGCSGTSSLTVRDTTTIEPVANNARRVAFRATGADGNYRLRLFNGTGSAQSYTMTVAETTLYSPAWSTNTTFDTYYSFQNTTTAALDGTLTLRNAAGAALGTFDVLLPPGRTTTRNTQTLGIPRNATGTASFTHDGPPGAILATATIANFTSVPAYSQPVKFLPLRESR